MNPGKGASPFCTLPRLRKSILLMTIKGLFVAEGFDGVEPGGVVGGVDAEEEADGGGDAEGDDD